MKDVRLSVVIANYNHGHFLKERIQSILDQLKENDEILIIDDASTDDSVDIINRFVSRDFRVRLMRNEKNLGVIKSANRVIQASRGKYVASLSADDRILPGFIEQTMKILEDNPTVPLCCSNCAEWFDDVPDKDPDKIYSQLSIQGVTVPKIFSAQEIIDVFFRTNFWIPGHTAIVKKDLLLQYGGLNEELGPFCDWFLLHSIALDHGAAYLPQNLSVWRRNVGCYSSVTDKRKIDQAEMNLFRAAAANRKKFRSSGLMWWYIRKRLLQLCIFPKYWDFIAVIVCRSLYKKYGKILRFFAKQGFFKMRRGG